MFNDPCTVCAFRSAAISNKTSISTTKKMNTTSGIQMDPSFENPIFKYVNKDAFIISISVFIAVSGIVNLFLIVVILVSSILRSSSKHLLVLAICTCGFYNAAFVNPLLVQYFSLGKWIHGCQLLVILDWKSPNITLSIESLLLVGLGVDLLVRLFTQKKLVSILLVMLMTTGAVTVSVAVILPLVLTGEVVYDLTACYLSFEEGYRIAVIAVSFFPHCFLMVVTIVLVSVASLASSNTAVAKPFPVDIAAACAVMIVLELPLSVFLITYNGCSVGDDCHRMFLLRGVLLSLVILRPCVMSLVWFTCPKTRKGIRQVCCCFKEPRELNEGLGQGLAYQMTTETGHDNYGIRM